MENKIVATELGMERYNSPKNPYKIVPGLMIHLEDSAIHHVGSVDRMEGEDYIKLSSMDSSDGESHWIPLSWVKEADDNAVFLNVTEKEFYEGILDRCPDEKQIAN